MTLPPDPSQFLAHCKAHITPTQKPTLQRAKNANALPSHPSRRNSIGLDEQNLNNITTISRLYITKQLHHAPKAKQ